MYHKGSTGPVVTQIQTAIGAVPDGQFGTNTRDLLKVWQAAHGLVPDGIAGIATLKAMSIREVPPVEDSLNPYKLGTVSFYEYEFRRMRFDAGYENQIMKAAKSLLPGKPRYDHLRDITGVPWTLIAMIHKMEGDGNFGTYLGNGQSIHRRTSIVPIGRGPFSTFEAGALDALQLDGLTGVKNWSTGLELQFAEKFNGLGYIRSHPSERSPYIWACSSVNDGTGKYVADGQYSPSANANAQVGVATMMKQLEILGEYKPVYTT